MGMSEKIKIALIKRKTTITQLSNKIGTSSQNLSNKIRQDNFREKELKEIAEALNCDFEGVFTMRDTGEKV